MSTTRADRPGRRPSAGALHRAAMWLGWVLLLLVPIGSSAQVTLKVGVYNFAPMVFVDEGNEARGLFVDVLEHVAKQEGWRLQYVPGTWQQTLTRLETGEVDLLLCIGPSEERRLKFDFTRQHLFLDWGLVYKGRGSRIETMSDLNGKRIGVLRGSIYTTAFRQLLDQFEVEARLVEMAEYKDIFQAIGQGELDAGINANVSGSALEGKYAVERTLMVFAPTKLSIAVRAGAQAAVMARLDHHLTALYEDKSSVYHQLIREWMGLGSREAAVPRWVIWSLAGLLGLAGLSLAHSAVLKRQVLRRTADLESARSYYDRILSAAPVGITTYDDTGTCLTSNRQAAELVGETRDDLIGTNFRASERWKQAGMAQSAEHALATGATTRSETRWGDVNGREVWIHSTFARFTVDGRPQIVHIEADVSDRVRAEEGLRQLNAEILEMNRTLESRVRERTAQLHEANLKLEKIAWDLARSNKELEEFAYVASHDLQEPLRMVVGFVQLLGKRLDGKLDAETREFMGFVVDGSLRMQQLIRDILAYSRVNTPAAAPALAESSQALGEALALLDDAIRRSGARVSVSHMPQVEVNATQLKQLFQNLVGNAIKFCKDRVPHIRIGAREEPTSWRFTVVDNGIGIAPEYAARIFGIFQRLHTADEYPGTGIGLAISKRIVERHGGAIGVLGAPGGGCEFWFTLPKEKKK